MPVLAVAKLAIVAALAANGTDTLRYELAVARDDSMRPVIDVRLRFRGSPRGRTLIELPHLWAGHSDLEKTVSRVRVARPASARLVDADSAHRRFVVHAPGAELEVRYRLHQD